MDLLTDKEIYNASDAIDDAFSMMTESNRGKTARIILKSVRDLNDHLADKLWNDLHPNEPMGLQKVASKLTGKYRFISQFDTFLRASVSHFTPSEDGSERLLIKYYKYLLQLKKLAWNKYKMDILKNISCFVDNTDRKTEEYYFNVSQCIESIPSNIPRTESDNYYIDKIKPFYVNNDIYYEITLEPAINRTMKFQHITAFTKHDIFDNYSVSLSFAKAEINVFNTQYPINVILDWHVSIRPCEIENFANLIGIDVNIQRRNHDYATLMDIITEEKLSLVDIIDLPNREYQIIITKLKSVVKNGKSNIVSILDKCRFISINNLRGVNIIRYLLLHLNNRIIKYQRPDYFSPNTYADYNMSSKCMPFDKMPYAHYPRKHVTNLFDLYQCIDASKHRHELLKRYIENNTYSNNILFTPINEIKGFGNKENILSLVDKYNRNLYIGFKPDSELSVYKDNLYIKGHEKGIFEIITTLNNLSTEHSEISEFFSNELIDSLQDLPPEDRLDDPVKEDILKRMFSASRVHCIYGAAGTGKTTLVNYICYLVQNKKRIFLAKTHPAVENLRRKVKYKNENDMFITIDQFTKSSWYKSYKCDLVVVDECSTVKNEEIIKIFERIGNSALILMGDTYQIEAIGFGNWFSIIKNTLPSTCCHELTTPYRSSNEYLKKLWTEVRNMTDNNIALERMVRSDYSHIIDDDIFVKKADDEIILCLNYDGLYGLNNINKLLQLSNPHSAIPIGIWQFKKGDPILFNDSERFSCLYNNLKGRILHIEDMGDSVYFSVEVDIELSERDVQFEDGLDFIQLKDGKSQVGFTVNKLKPYSTDNDETTNYHIIPFQIAYAVSIHKSQGLEYDSVKIVIADETEERISHDIFYTAITRAKKFLTIYWSPEVCNRIISRIRPMNSNRDFYLIKSKRAL